MGALRQIPGKPGMFILTTASGERAIKLVEWKEDYVYDTVEVVAGAIAAGTQWFLFQNLQNKNRIDCNLATPRRLTSGTEMILNQIGIQPGHNSPGFTECDPLDFSQLCERLVYEFRINSLIVAQGPVHAFPSGMGPIGSTVTAGTGMLSNGLASPAAVPRLLVPQTINSDNDLSGVLTHSAAAWMVGPYVNPIMAAGFFMRNSLRGYVKLAVGKG